MEWVDWLSVGPPAEDIMDGLFEEADWPCVTAAYEGVVAEPLERVVAPCVFPTLEAESSGIIEHSAIPRVTLFEGVSGILPACKC